MQSQDLDFVVDLGAFQIPRFVDVFGADFYRDEAMVRDAVRSRDMFSILHEDSGWKVDLVLAKDDPYRQLELSRRVSFRVGQVDLPVVSREDLILTKLWWSKDSGSEMQRRDVGALVRMADTLDWAYLERWAPTWTCPTS